MGTIRVRNSDRRLGRIDRAKFDAATEEQIQAWKESEGYGDFDFDAPPVTPEIDVRKIGEDIGR